MWRPAHRGRRERACGLAKARRVGGLFRWADSSRALVRTQPPPRGIQCWLAAWAGTGAGTGLVAQEEAQEEAQEQRLVCGVRPLRSWRPETTPTGPLEKYNYWVLGTARK